MSDLIIPAGFSIETTDGHSVTLDQGANFINALPGAGSGEPLWRISVGQPRDARYPEASNQLFAIRKVRGVNEEGEIEATDQVLGPFGARLQVRVIGLHLPLGLVRSYMPKYDPNASDENRKPFCRSENGFRPDAEYMGRFSTACVQYNAQTGKVVAACPMAQWGEKDANGKGKPPSCQEQYLVIVAFQWEDQQIVAEAYFKSSSAQAGRTLVQQLNALIGQKHLPLYAYPVELALKEAGIGNTFIPRMILPSSVPGYGGPSEAELLPQETEIEDLETAVSKAQEAFRIRLERSQRLPEDTQPSAEPAETVTDVQQPAAPGVDFNKLREQRTANNKKAVKPLI